MKRKNLLVSKSNKKGAIGIGTLMIAVLILGGIIGGAIWFSSKQAVTKDVESPSACADSTASLNFNAKQFYDKSSDVSGSTPYGRIDGSDIKNLSAVSSFGVGSKITDVFYSASDYIDMKSDSFTVTCGMTQAPVVYMKATDNPDTFLIKNDAGTTLTDTTTGGANNASSTNGTLELELRAGISQDKTTGSLIIVAEYDNTTQADDISIGSFDSISTPEVYSASASNSLIKTFRISEVTDGNTEDYALKVYPESGQEIGLGGVALRITRYSEQAFEDKDGSLTEGVENSDGTAKYEDTGTYNIFVV